MLKELFQFDIPNLLTRILGDVTIEAFLNVELPKVRERQLDLVILLEDGSLIHVEIQSTHDPEIKYRMAEYYSTQC